MCTKKLDEVLSLRMCKEDVEGFKKACKALGRPYQDMLRELVSAFSDNRVKITQTEKQKKAGGIYDVA